MLLHNNHDGTFTDVTAKAGVGDDGLWGTAAGWFDYDHDGLLDLLVTNYVQFDVDHPVHCGDDRPGYHARIAIRTVFTAPRRASITTTTARFTDVTEKAGLTNQDGKSLAVVLADLNNDGWTDIFIANDTQRNFVYLNNGDGTFRDDTYKSNAGFSEDGRTGSGNERRRCRRDEQRPALPVRQPPGFRAEPPLSKQWRRHFHRLHRGLRLGQTNILNSAFGARSSISITTAGATCSSSTAIFSTTSRSTIPEVK